MTSAELCQQGQGGSNTWTAVGASSPPTQNCLLCTAGPTYLTVISRWTMERSPASTREQEGHPVSHSQASTAAQVAPHPPPQCPLHTSAPSSTMSGLFEKREVLSTGLCAATSCPPSSLQDPSPAHPAHLLQLAVHVLHDEVQCHEVFPT